MGGIDRGVKLAAEREARRKLDPKDDYPRRVGQFKYDAVDALSEGRGRGVFSTAPLQRERSCTVELRTLLEDQVGELQPVKVGARGSFSSWHMAVMINKRQELTSNCSGA